MSSVDQHEAGSAGESTGFAQTGLAEGNYIVEIRIDRGGDIGFWKAGTKEPVRGIVSEAKDGRLQTFTNEALRKEAVKAVFRHFCEHFELHPDFEWRSIKEDLEARQSKESDPPKSTNEGKMNIPNWDKMSTGEKIGELMKNWQADRREC